MGEYLIVHRAGEIYKLRFQFQAPDFVRLTTDISIFYPVYGWELSKVLTWLDERNFEYYWETDHD